MAFPEVYNGINGGLRSNPHLSKSPLGVGPQGKCVIADFTKRMDSLRKELQNNMPFIAVRIAQLQENILRMCPFNRTHCIAYIIIGALDDPYIRDLKYIWYVIAHLSRHTIRNYGCLTRIRS